MRKTPILGFTVALAAIAFGGWLILSDQPQGDAGTATAAEINVPVLSPVALNGKAAFESRCAVCHGENGAGSDKGPPLIHKIYEPGHHGDQAFWLAARNGVRSHHWRFGDMPPVEGVSDTQLGWIVKYIREVQSANGIN
jgi:mono/diheme cytochrome c family protein